MEIEIPNQIIVVHVNFDSIVTSHLLGIYSKWLSFYLWVTLLLYDVQAMVVYAPTSDIVRTIAGRHICFAMVM